MVVNTVAGYLLLQRALPMFLQLVSADSNLWSEEKGLLMISLPRTLTTPRYELRRFVYYDIMCALTLGVAPLAEYDSRDFPLIPETPPQLERIHGVPHEFLVTIAQVHAWRTAHPGVPNDTDWAALELRAFAWDPRSVDIYGEDSFEMVSRMAVQESWRHATLIYICMVSHTYVWKA
jgi:hypothetical protein